MTVRIIQSEPSPVKIISQENIRIKQVFTGPPGRSGSVASISSDADNVLTVGGDGGIHASYGAGFLFVADDGADQVFGPIASALRNNGGLSQNKLKRPFDAAILVSPAGLFTPRAVDDVYRVVVRLTVSPSVINTDISVQLDIGGGFGVIETDRHRLSLGAGVDHQETFIFPPFTGSTFVANGGTFLVNADSSVTVKSVDYRIFPESAG